MSFSLKDLEKKFHADGYRLAMKAVQAGIIPQVLREAVQEMHRLVDEVIANFSDFAAQQNQSPHCKKGCSWCCHQPVFALSYELDNLNDYLKENFSFDEQEHIIARAEAKRDKLDGLRGDALLNSKFACPLLKDGECMAYEARPVSCRIYLSSDVDSCKQFYYKPASAGAVPALLDFPMRMGRMINEGFRAALKANGIPVEEHRIEQGIANRYH
jgi:Fe-S-cluster containining protein